MVNLRCFTMVESEKNISLSTNLRSKTWKLNMPRCPSWESSWQDLICSNYIYICIASYLLEDWETMSNKYPPWITAHTCKWVIGMSLFPFWMAYVQGLSLILGSVNPNIELDIPSPSIHHCIHKTNCTRNLGEQKTHLGPCSKKNRNLACVFTGWTHQLTKSSSVYYQ